MNLLLDTHVIIWCAAVPERLASATAKVIEDPVSKLYYSPISVWETVLLAEKGRIDIGPDPIKATRRLVTSLPIIEASLNTEVAIASRELRLPHQDPADRFIAATALVYDLILVTADTRLLKTDTVRTMQA